MFARGGSPEALGVRIRKGIGEQMKRDSIREGKWSGSSFESVHGVSERIALHADNATLFEQALHGLPVAIFILDADGRLAFHNRALDRLLKPGGAPAEPGAALPDFLPEPL